MASRSSIGIRAHGPTLAILVCAAAVAAAIHVSYCRALLRSTRGQWIAPIDDTYIHLQYARALAEGRGLQYQPGDGYSGGATSPLWVALLAPAVKALPPERAVATSIGLGAGFLGVALAALGLAMLAARRRAMQRSESGSESESGSRSASSSLLLLPAAAPAFVFFAGQGFLSWAALSGMETMMFAALVSIALALVAHWQPSSPPPLALLVTCALLPLARPDGVLVTGLVALLIAWRGRHRPRRLATLATLAAVLTPALVALLAHRLAYGRFATAGLEMKSASYLPYVASGEALAMTARASLKAVRHLFLGGAPGFPPAWLSLLFAALGLLALARELRARRLGAAALAWPLLLAFLWSAASVAVPQFRQDRYFVPAIATLALLGALGAVELGALLAAKLRRPGAALACDLALAAAALVALVPTGRFWQRTFAADAVAIQRKQVSAARWLVANTPPAASVLVCDAGALAFLSGRRVFDIVGLAARHAGNAYLSGAGSRFEETERAGPARWPTHAALYSWCGWPGAFVTPLSTHADLVVSRFVEEGLGSAEAPLDPALARRDALDRLDLADLASERAHAWREADGGSRDRDVIGRHLVAGRPVADGGRVIQGSATFALEDPGTVTAGRALLLRTEPGARGILRIGGARYPIAAPATSPVGFAELIFPVPDRSRGAIEVTVEAIPDSATEEPTDSAAEASAAAPLPLYSVWLLGGS